MGIRFQMIQGKATQARMQGIQERLRKPFSGPAGKAAVAALRDGVGEQFRRKAYMATKGGAQPWPKRRGRGAWPLLQKTRTLFTAWAGGPGATQSVEPTRVAIGVSVFYAKFHQLGTRFMPKRQVGVTPRAEKAIAAAIRDYVLGKSSRQRSAA